MVNKPLQLVSIKNGGGSVARSRNIYVKAYQNNGKNYGISSDMYSKNGDPHSFVILGVGAGEKIKVCIAGRSFTFEVYRIILKKCNGRLCHNGGRI